MKIWPYQLVHINMGPEIGNEFTSDDVANCSSILFTPLRLCSHANRHDFFKVRRSFSSKMSDSDGDMSSSGSFNVQESESSNKVV